MHKSTGRDGCWDIWLDTDVWVGARLGAQCLHHVMGLIGDSPAAVILLPYQITDDLSVRVPVFRSTMTT